MVSNCDHGGLLYNVTTNRSIRNEAAYHAAQIMITLDNVSLLKPLINMGFRTMVTRSAYVQVIMV